MYKKAVYVILIALFCVFLLNPVLALKTESTGTSSITLSSTVVNMTRSENISIIFTITLTGGSTWGTDLQISNAYPNYFSFSISPPTGDPTYSGTLGIYDVKATPLGEYHFNVSATGDDPSAHSVVLTVDVVNSTNITPPASKPPTSQSNNAGITVYFWYIMGIMAAIMISLILVISHYKEKFALLGMELFYGSVVISIASSLYLLLFDSMLMDLAIMHWYALLIFLMLNIIATFIIYSTKDPYAKQSKMFLGVLSFIFSISMILDAILNLPFSSVNNNIEYFGINYLFGFGSNNSILAISVAYSLLLLCCIVNGFALVGVVLYGKDKHNQ
ncbi:MAG: hypothetical protein ACP5RS_06985 [Thermoplasmata archaeon]